ncbi:MAG: hypothetical protein KAS32_18390, partial [Candidatus Peribacteraceae bacterium]|nr:hypothetical protein [Candidatus Peribacteraceae bacterium]
MAGNVAAFQDLQVFVRLTRDSMITDSFYKHNNVIGAMLWEHRGDFSGRQLVRNIRKSGSGLTQEVDNMENFQISIIDTTTAATYNPKMLVTPLTLDIITLLKTEGAQAVMDYIKEQMFVTFEDIADDRADAFWNRTATAVTNTKTWNNWENIIGGATDLGNILPSNLSDPLIWTPQTLTQADFSTGLLTNQADLEDPTKDVYLEKVIGRLIARTKNQPGTPPDLVVLGSQLFDTLASLLKVRQTGSPMSDLSAEMSVEFIKFRNTPVISDSRSDTFQTSNVDGKISAMNFLKREEVDGSRADGP